MKIAISPYTLHARGSLNSRTRSSERFGVLVRVEWASHLVGYADCFPWPELGDVPLDAQLRSLRDGAPTSLTERTLAWARRDAEARSLKQSLFSQTVPASHYLATNLESLSEAHLNDLESRGFKSIKVKMTPSSEFLPAFTRVAERCAGRFRFRLDANGSLSASAALAFAQQVQSFHLIDFWEDPCDYNPAIWNQINAWVPLALDRLPQDWRHVEGGFQAVVCKPAVQDPNWIHQWTALPICVTSYMDHPIGQCFAAVAAADLAAQRPVLTCGLQSHHVYESTAYSEVLGDVRSEFTVPSGYGIGFDELLEREPWKNL